MAELRKLDLSCIESLLDLYSMIVDGGKWRTLRIVSRIFSLNFMSPSPLFQTLKISSLCLTLSVAPQILGHSPAFSPPSLSQSCTPLPSSCSRPVVHSSNWSPMMPRTRSSQIRSETPFLRRIIHFPPERLSGSSQTGLRTPEWKRR